MESQLPRLGYRGRYPARINELDKINPNNVLSGALAMSKKMDKKLYQAVEASDWSTVRELVTRAPARLRKTDSLMGSLLNYAAREKNLEELQWLVQQGLSIDFSEGCNPPISNAIDARDLDLVSKLIEMGADVNIAPGEKPLIYCAISSESVELVRLLVENGASLDSTWGCWDSPLAIALSTKSRYESHARKTGTKVPPHVHEIADYLAGQSELSEESNEALAKKVTDLTRDGFPKKLEEDDLRELEKELGLEIPPTYRAFLARFPDELVTDGRDGIFHSTDLIVRSTMGSRDYCEEDWSAPYPENLIDVGWNGGASVYCIREGESGDQIYLFDHEMGDIDPTQTLTLDEFVAMVKEWSDQ